MFRFTIRDVLWLMVVVGLGVGWLADRARMEGAERRWRRYSSDLATQLANAKGETVETTMPDGRKWNILSSKPATLNRP